MSVTDYKLVIVLRENSHKKNEKLTMMPAVCIYFQYFCHLVVCNLFVFVHIWRWYIQCSLCMVFFILFQFSCHLDNSLILPYQF